MHDEAPAHYATSVRHSLCETFPKDLQQLWNAIITEMARLAEELCQRACQSVPE